MAKQKQTPIKSVKTAFNILNAIKDLNGAGVSELSRYLELPKSTVHNYLRTLEQEEYILNRNAEYQIGIRFLELGAYARHQQKLFKVAKPKVDELATDTGELANVLVEEHGLGSYLHRARGDQAVQVEAHMGNRVRLHSTALGKVILAYLPEDRVEEIIHNHKLGGRTEKTIATQEELYDALEDVRKEGIAFDDEERLNGLRCVAAPILDSGNNVVGAISVSGPTGRFKEKRFREELPQRVLETANVIELDFNYS